MVARLEVEPRLLADRAQGDEVLLAARGHAIDDRVAECADGEAERLFRLVRILLGRLHSRGEVLRLRDECLLLVLRSRGDLLAEQVLFCAQLFERRDRRATFDVCEKCCVDKSDGFAPRLLRAFDQVGIFAKQNGIDHGSQSSSGAASAVAPPGNEYRKAHGTTGLGGIRPGCGRLQPDQG